MTKHRYLIRASETGDIIESASTEAEAWAILEQYEDEDEKNGFYTEGFYEVYDAKKHKIIK